jgi:hypothetical protein
MKHPISALLRLVGLIIWVLIGPIMIITFWIAGTLEFSFFRLYLPLLILISSILFTRRLITLANRREKIDRAMLGLEIERIKLARSKIRLKILDLQEELGVIEERDRKEEILDIKMLMLEDQVRARKSPNKTS